MGGHSHLILQMLSFIPTSITLETPLVLISLFEFGSKIINTRLEHPSPQWTAGLALQSPPDSECLTAFLKSPGKLQGIVSCPMTVADVLQPSSPTMPFTAHERSQPADVGGLAQL